MTTSFHGSAAPGTAAPGIGLLPPSYSSFLPDLLVMLAEDLAALLCCDWLIAWEYSGAGLTPVSFFGHCPDPAACLRRATSFQRSGCELAADWRLDRSLGPAAFFPIGTDHGPAGLIAVGPPRQGTLCQASDLECAREACREIGRLSAVPRLAALVAERAHHALRRRRELELAREVQGRFLAMPPAPVPGIDYHGDSRPYGEVGGDFYDFHLLPDGSFAVALGDISGKGASAAILAASLQTALRGLDTLALPPARTVDELNRLLCHISSAHFFATLFYARLDPAHGILSYVNAGHESPLLVRRSRQCVPLPESGGQAVGIHPSACYTANAVTIEPGDLLVAFTDGVTDARNPDGEEYQVGRLRRALRSLPPLPASRITAHLQEEVERFASPGRAEDDRTIVAVRAA
jgi:phosphoserine phosphatase RsbU/P